MIFITGCARSGTSLTSQILQAHGFYLGPKKSVNGLFENFTIREKVIKPYLQSIGADPLGQKPLAENLKPFPELRSLVLEYMGEFTEPWLYKCAKLAPIWPLWKEAFPEAKYVIVRRDAEKIIDSCMRTGFMRAFPSRSGWKDWVEAHEKKFEEMKANLDCIENWTDELIEDPASFKSVAEFCGVEFNETATRNCIDQNKWHKAR